MFQRFEPHSSDYRSEGVYFSNVDNHPYVIEEMTRLAQSNNCPWAFFNLESGNSRFNFRQHYERLRSRFHN